MDKTDCGNCKSIVNKEHLINELFIEKKYPTETENKEIHDPEVLKIMEEMHSNSMYKSWHYSDEENAFYLRNRAFKALDYLQNLERENILVVSHGAFISMMISIILFGNDFPIEIYEKFRQNSIKSNTGISVIIYDKKWRLNNMNDDAHLGQISKKN